ncbi:hypothetical protein [Mycolicibacterium sp. 050158]|uniref:hypothetical protein n=1 Tax=Mycolicibacterium sp. 050158 TaxID=3090602 RepID=UPI00299D7BD0|nr:hypothetical protein [Mycolicibacterium sp. 050158]MDX1893421.1 hypothetical protein [Mycolicibacterium sp. 050158]
MFEDAEALQATSLLKELHNQVDKVSCKLEIVERRNRRRSARGIADVHRQQSELRRELREAHRLIDGLHHRYPETLTDGQPQQSPTHA